MRVRLACHRCDAEVVVAPADDAARCAACGWTKDLRWTAAARAGDLDVCPVCGRTDFYRFRQFHRGLGLSIVAAAAASDFVGWTWRHGLPLALLAAVLVDAVLYRIAPEAVCCYKCKTFFEDAPGAGRIPAFDSGTELKYEIEAEREAASDRASEDRAPGDR